MGEQRYVMLRRSGPGRGAGVFPATLGHGADPMQGLELKVEEATLSAADARDAARDPEVFGSAPVMPVMLISPKDTDTAAAEAHAAAAKASGAAWGVSAVGAVESPVTGAGVTVAILDTGILRTHDAFKDKPIEEKDFTGEGNGDLNGHGTHCAGTVFGGPVGGIRIGVAPGVKRALIGKVLNKNGRGSSAQLVDGLLWAVREGANVVSVSIGFDFPRMVKELVELDGLALEAATSKALTMYRDNLRLFDAVAQLVKAHSAMFSKAVVIAAAGNESKRPKYQIATAAPAAADGFISVGALEQRSDGNLGIATFSNSGPLIAGPGVAIQSAGLDGGLVLKDGTSMATPHVAGVAALWFERIKTISPNAHIRQLEGSLLNRASLDKLAPGEDVINAGAGMCQAPPK